MKKNNSPFDKFGRKKSNAAIKEQFRQEKRKVKKEREEYFEKKKAEARLRTGIAGQKPERSQQAIRRELMMALLQCCWQAKMPLKNMNCSQ